MKDCVGMWHALLCPLLLYGIHSFVIYGYVSALNNFAQTLFLMAILQRVFVQYGERGGTGKSLLSQHTPVHMLLLYNIQLLYRLLL